MENEEIKDLAQIYPNSVTIMFIDNRQMLLQVFAIFMTIAKKLAHYYM